jgi:hypothetical protein
MNKLRVEPFTTITAQCPSLVDEETGEVVAKVMAGESYEDADLFAHELCRRINSSDLMATIIREFIEVVKSDRKLFPKDIPMITAFMQAALDLYDGKESDF